MVPDWPDASCNNENPDLFFPEASPGLGSAAKVRKQAGLAVRVCHECPREDQCLARALEMQAGEGVEGVWGGAWFHNGKIQSVHRSAS